MRRWSGMVVALVVATPLLAGCQTNEQTGGLMGALGGGALGCLAGGLIGHNATGTALGCAGGAVAGYFAGSAIGRQLDERDRERALQATREVLYQPVYYPPGSTATVYPKSKPVHWNSDHNAGVKGTATLVSVQPKPDGGECRVVRNVAYIKGQEVQQESRECRTADGSFVDTGAA